MLVTTVSYGRVSGKARQYPYYQACLYKYRPRKDGILTARLICTVNMAHRSKRLAEIDARRYADENHVDYKDNVRQNHIFGEK